MSQWHREHPELVGSEDDPWMQHESYRKVAPMSEVERDRLRDERAVWVHESLRNLSRLMEEEAPGWGSDDEDRLGF